MLVHPISLSITSATGDMLRVKVHYEIESNEWDIASQQVFNHRCTLENALLAGGPNARPVLVELSAEPRLLFGRPENHIVDIDVTVPREALTGDGMGPTALPDTARVRAWVYVVQPAASDAVETPGLERSPGLPGAR